MRRRSLKTQQRSQTSRPRGGGYGCFREEYLVVPLGTTFEHELKVKIAGLRAGNKSFTESLILAQDERWRRA